MNNLTPTSGPQTGRSMIVAAVFRFGLAALLIYPLIGYLFFSSNQDIGNILAMFMGSIICTPLALLSLVLGFALLKRRRWAGWTTIAYDCLFVVAGPFLDANNPIIKVISVALILESAYLVWQMELLKRRKCGEA